MAEELLRLDNVTKVWNPGTSRAVIALEDLSFSVNKEEFVVVIGPSGCGKSTLLYCIAGLETPTTGTMTLDELPIEGTSTDRSLIFQDPSLFPWLSVVDNVEWGLKIRGVPKGERRDRACHYLHEVGLSDSLKKHPHELSGGMKQRTAIARALCLEPKVLLMDEPFAALDVQTRYKLQNFLLEIWERTKTTIVFVTHHIDEAINLADRVVVLTACPGRLLEISEITLPRPRDVSSKAFDEYRSNFFGRLRSEVSKAFEAQEMVEIMDTRIK